MKNVYRKSSRRTSLYPAFLIKMNSSSCAYCKKNRAVNNYNDVLMALKNRIIDMWYNQPKRKKRNSGNVHGATSLLHKPHGGKDDQLSHQRLNNEKLINIITQLRSGLLSGDQLNEHVFWSLIRFIKRTMIIRSSNKEDIILMHELGKKYRSTSAGLQEFQEDLTTMGSEPASAKTIRYIHNILKENECPVWDVPVYKLTNYEPGTDGITTPHGIWIDEKYADKKTLSHEAGHWLLQHGLRKEIEKKPSIKHDEYEADVFSYNCLSFKERKKITESYLEIPKHERPEPYFSNWMKVAQEHNEVFTK